MRHLRTIAPLLLLLLWAGKTWADIPYVVEIAGVGDKAIKAELEANSELVKLKDRPPASETALRRRADADAARLKLVVEAAGYRAATVAYSVDLAATPARITVTVATGPLYRLESVTLITAAGEPPPVVGDAPLARFGLQPGGAAASAAVLDAEPRIVEALTQRGYPFAKVAARKVVVDHDTRTMNVTYTVEAGAPASFGAAAIDGLADIDRGYVERRIAWTRGRPFDSRDVEATRKALVDSGLFTVVRIESASDRSPDGDVAMSVHLVERLPRSVGGGLSYDTSEGFGGKAFWEHRNLFGGAEALRFRIELAEARLGGILEFRRPDLFGRKEDSLLASLEVAHDTPVAYTSQRQRVFNGVERRFNPSLVGGAGLQFETGDVTEEARQLSQSYYLLGVPLYLRRDTTRDLLDPTSGTRVSITATPYASVSGNRLDFINTRLSGSAYYAFDDGERFVLASFGAVGSVAGEARDSLPADKRLYAGGGGSLRGYGYQLAGSLGPGDKPLGGRTSLEFGAELRVKITDSIGIVPFVEAGNVYAENYPDLSRGLLYDAGIGARYYTPIGPVRLDVATPLNRRSGDSSFQIYISIGQAF